MHIYAHLIIAYICTLNQGHSKLFKGAWCGSHKYIAAWGVWGHVPQENDKLISSFLGHILVKKLPVHFGKQDFDNCHTSIHCEAVIANCM